MHFRRYPSSGKGCRALLDRFWPHARILDDKHDGTFQLENYSPTDLISPYLLHHLACYPRNAITIPVPGQLIQWGWFCLCTAHKRASGSRTRVLLHLLTTMGCPQTGPHVDITTSDSTMPDVWEYRSLQPYFRVSHIMTRGQSCIALCSNASWQLQNSPAAQRGFPLPRYPGPEWGHYDRTPCIAVRKHEMKQVGIE
jgi:hypothetical protein